MRRIWEAIKDLFGMQPSEPLGDRAAWTPGDWDDSRQQAEAIAASDARAQQASYERGLDLMEAEGIAKRTRPDTSVKLSPRQRGVLTDVIRKMEGDRQEDYGPMSDEDLLIAFDRARGMFRDRGGDENTHSETLMGVGLVLLPKDRAAEWEAWEARSPFQKLMDAARGVEGPWIIMPEKGVAVRFSMDDLHAEAKESAARAGPAVERGYDLEL